MFQPRYLNSLIKEFLPQKMVFIGGPRQVGKTTLCLRFISPPSVKNPAYLNWDNIVHREKIRKGELPSMSETIVFDEIHKYKPWRNLIKGLYDIHSEDKKFLVTGSARLDHYKRGGDSLLGRYRYVRLHPFSFNEFGGENQSDLSTLLKFGGFPEPLFSGSERRWKLWRRERLYRIVHDDIRNLENLREYSLIETLAEALPDRVGSPLSINSIAEDLNINPRTAENWVKILEQVYYCFRIPPYGAPKIRAVKKEKKLYVWDWSTLDEPGSRFENMVASHLLKYCHFVEDSEGDNMELRFLRDKSGREVDFVVLKNKRPVFAVECKTGERNASAHMQYFKDRTTIPKFYQVHLGKKDFSPASGLRVLPFTQFCKEISLP